jgi:hypothetical protein
VTALRLAFHRVDDWPPLAWLAACDRASAIVKIYCGRHVEVRERWFCEAVWAGDFEAGDFDATDLIAGSGGRMREDGLVFVSSGSTVDRLQSMELTGVTLVSNSLPCLLEAADATVDPTYQSYYRDFRTVIDGLERVKDTLITSRGAVRLTYFRNLMWNGEQLARAEKPCGARQFSSFEAYKDFLDRALETIGSNMRARSRNRAYVPLGTLSTGYDSTAVAVLCRCLGLRDVISFRKARGGDIDDGTPVAERLGMRVISSNRESWRAIPLATVAFLATNGYGEEVHYAAAAQSLGGRVLFTGYHGGGVWAKGTHDLSPNIVRKDPTGLSLSEFRLGADFIHYPVPFLGVRQIADIHRISHSVELKPWDVAGGYSRPIPRRIAEEAGIPRNLFGMAKRATSIVLWNRDEGFLPAADLADYEAWLVANESAWRSARKLSPLQLKERQRRRERLTVPLTVPVRHIAAAIDRLSANDHHTYYIRRLLDPLSRFDPRFAPLLPWALGRAKQRYKPGFDLIRSQHLSPR